MKKALRHCVAACLLALGVTMSPRADGLPGEYLISTWWRDITASYSPLSNPALLLQENYLALHGAQSFVMGNDFSLTEAGVTVPIGWYQSIGLTYCGEAPSTIEGYEWRNWSDAAYQAQGTQTFQTNHVYATWAFQPWQRLGVGLNGVLAHQRRFDEGNKVGFGLDAGITWRLFIHPQLGSHWLGLSFQNVIPPAIGGQTYSRNLRLSWVGQALDNQLQVMVNVGYKDFLEQATRYVDKKVKPEWEASGYLGGWIARLLGIYAIVGGDNTGLDYGGLATGFNFPAFNRGRDLMIMYQITGRPDNLFALSHSIFLKADLGLHREDFYAHSLGRVVDLKPTMLYNQGRKLHGEGNYWDAFFVFSQILVEYPGFFKNDYVSYLRANCLEKLDMREAAIDAYLGAIKAHGASPVVPYCQLGLMEVYYRQNNAGKVADLYASLSKPTVPDSVSSHATYLMAESHARAGAHAKSLDLLGRVPPAHPDYPYAQHSAAVMELVSRGDTAAAINHLAAVFRYAGKDRASMEIVNRSCIFLGYLYYEMGDMSQAIVALRKVPSSSIYCVDALLGQGWTALRSRQWDDCRTAGEQLLSVAPRGVLRCEGALLKSYSLVMNKDYPGAVRLLTGISRILDELAPPSQDTLAARQDAYGVTRSNYAALADEVLKISTARQSETVMSMVDSMHAKQKEIASSIDKYHRFAFSFDRATLFGMNLKPLRDDVNYALGSAQKLAMKYSKDVLKSREQEKKIDDDIEKLKQELKELEKNGKDR